MSGRKPRTGRAGRGGGFTIIELMLVVFIITLLIGIGVPSIHQIRLTYRISLTRATLNMLEEGCEMYRLDFEPKVPVEEPWKAYPPGGNNSLVWALTGYVPDAGQDKAPGLDPLTDDGADDEKGWGFRLSASGKIFGPYNSAEKVPTKNAARPVFQDSFGNTIFYFRFEGDSPGEFVGGDTVTTSNNPQPNMEAYAKNSDNKYMRKDLILCTKGPDSLWGSRDPDDNNAVKFFRTFPSLDDITNFLEED